MTHCLRVGVGGPVGSGKTALLRQLCTALRDHYDIAVVTNDIYTREDADFLLRHEALAADRILGVDANAIRIQLQPTTETTTGHLKQALRRPACHGPVVHQQIDHRQLKVRLHGQRAQRPGRIHLPICGEGCPCFGRPRCLSNGLG